MFMRGRPITMFIPADVENYEDVRTELPPEKLKLEWVYPFFLAGLGPKHSLTPFVPDLGVSLLSVSGLRHMSKQKGGGLIGLHFHLSSCFLRGR